MPSVSRKQHRFFEAIAHSPSFAKKAGVPQSVGKDFARADDKAGITKTHSGSSPKSREEHMGRMRTQGASHASIGKAFGVSKSTAHRIAQRGYK
jgi:hypothetical protein